METRIDLGFLEAHIRPPENGADHVVEIVRDAAGKLPNALELLRLNQLLF